MNKFLVYMILIIISMPVHAVKIDYSDTGITDDDIAKGIKAPRPVSVSDIIARIKASGKLDDIVEVDLSCNNITARGAVQVLEFCSTHLPKLGLLNLKGNRIYDLKAEENYGDFEDKLSALLAKAAFQSVDLRVNTIASLTWFSRISKVVGATSSKINWKNPSSQAEE